MTAATTATTATTATKRQSLASIIARIDRAGDEASVQASKLRAAVAALSLELSRRLPHGWYMSGAVRIEGGIFEWCTVHIERGIFEWCNSDGEVCDFTEAENHPREVPLAAVRRFAEAVHGGLLVRLLDEVEARAARDEALVAGIATASSMLGVGGGGIDA